MARIAPAGAQLPIKILSNAVHRGTEERGDPVGISRVGGAQDLITVPRPPGPELVDLRTRIIGRTVLAVKQRHGATVVRPRRGAV